TGLRGISQRRGASLVTVIGVTTVVGVLVSLLSMSEGAEIFSGNSAPPDQMVVLGRGAQTAPQSVLTRDAFAIISDAPGVKHAPDGRPYSLATSMVSVDAIKKDGKRGNVFLVGFTSAVDLVQPNVKVVEGRTYKPAVHEAIVSDPIRKMYRGMNIGDRINLRGSEWTIVGVFAGTDSLGDSVLRADAETVMSAFARNTFQQANVKLGSVADIPKFKDALSSNPAISVDVKTQAQSFKDGFGQLNQLLDFVAYFVGGVMASGAIFGALNSLYASVDSRRREIATLRAIGFSNGPIVLSVLIEGMLLALPGAFLGAGIAAVLFNGNVVNTGGLIFKLTVTPHLVVVSIFWALAIGLIGGSLPALRAARLPVATALRAT
ncbi:MAG TPA: FtsX-like permease family protein, partial [Steroidobacteraceae bacterium]|nr:FtsX-like permease family protein [Steroidobacteraceae bacterium]